VTGGLVESKVWIKIAADMFRLPVAVPKNKEGSACGAAMVAGLALGVWVNIEDIVEMIVFSDHIQTNADANKFYKEQYNWFQKSLLLTSEFSNLKEQNQ
jgi:glycerol kinase